MNHIGIDVRMHQHSGIGRYIRNLVWALQKLNHDFKFKLFGPPEAKNLIQDSKICSLIDSKEKVYSISEQIILPLKYYKKRLSLLHIPHYNVPIFYHGKVLSTVHDLTHLKVKLNPIKKFYASKMIKIAVNRSEKVITVSNYIKASIIDAFDVDIGKISVIHEGVGEKFKPRDGPREFNFEYILYVGLVKEHKNILKLIRAFNGIPYSGLKLVLIGKEDQSYLDKIKKEIDLLKLNDRVILLSEISEDELLRYYRNASVFVQPSLEEGFGLTILESLASGVPVAASKSASIPEVLGDCGEYFNPENETDIKEKILYLLKNQEVSKKYVEKGLERVKIFNWVETARETLKVYDQVLRSVK